ncbi:winged helix-turn-helix domain-containing protein [Maribacter sp. HTCC2170]|uniref:winged helix-turn-helix domain-containing protein n=1 Tax=Maribacter sp. (strain HTCC2170 / KCCM 42371) TaxID=313603 RepID=UPI00006AFC71|nr:winged helix DNA-binding domain-containing protein [Maribacter sp. HTCC2170]EAR01302.1 hypothetical protein FB2170_11296 [Maribacter sp. HTCC2170]
MTKPIESISLALAQKIALHSQRIPPAKQNGTGLNGTLGAIEHLGYIQIDTISTIQRAHHHTLWNRNPRYRTSHLEQLMFDKNIFEYWAHAAAYLPMKDYRFSLPRKEAIANGKDYHWYKPNTKLMKLVRKRIESEGPLMVKDFENKGKKLGEWQTKPTKQALELLYMQGELMVSTRKNFHKVYDLTERVLPSDVDFTMPTTTEHTRFLITRYLKANGLGLAAEMAYLLKNTKKNIIAALNEMVLNGEVQQIKVKDIVYHVLPSSLDLLKNPLKRNSCKILSPFDNLIIQRKRISHLFEFDYLLECYVPAAKRKFGYFVLPILWNGKLVARMDCKADRKTAVMHIHQLHLEPTLKQTERFANALAKELDAFMQFNSCTSLKVHKTSPTGFKTALLGSVDGYFK